MLSELACMHCCTCHTLCWVLTYCMLLLCLQEIGVQVEEPFGILALEVWSCLAWSRSHAHTISTWTINAHTRRTCSKPASFQCTEMQRADWPVAPLVLFSAALLR
jgi:hypothetical protein